MVLEDRTLPHGALAAIDRHEAQQIQRAYADFSQTLFNDVASTLFRGSASQIAGNRPAFNQEMTNAVASLEAEVSTKLVHFPLAKRTLTPSIDRSLVSGPNSLLGQIGALPSPTDTNGPSAASFDTQAAQIVQNSLQNTLSQVDSFFIAPNPVRATVMASHLRRPAASSGAASSPSPVGPALISNGALTGPGNGRRLAQPAHNATFLNPNTRSTFSSSLNTQFGGTPIAGTLNNLTVDQPNPNTGIFRPDFVNGFGSIFEEDAPGVNNNMVVSSSGLATAPGLNPASLIGLSNPFGNEFSTTGSFGPAFGSLFAS
jgi:hypothetical protein